MSDNLRAFLEDWLKWASSYAVDTNHSGYNASMGLCEAASSYSEGKLEDTDELSLELHRLFREEGLSIGYPFGYRDYHIRERASTQHECPTRLAWVRKHLETPNEHT